MAGGAAAFPGVQHEATCHPARCTSKAASQLQAQHMQAPLLTPLTSPGVQLDFPFSEAAAATPPPAWPLIPPHPQAAPQTPGGSSPLTQPSPPSSRPASQAASQAAAGSGQKPPRPPGAAPSRHYAPLSHLAEEGLQRKGLPAGQDSGMQDVPVVAGTCPSSWLYRASSLQKGPSSACTWLPHAKGCMSALHLPAHSMHAGL